MQHLEALDLKADCSQDNPDRYNHRFPYAHLKVSHIQNMGEKKKSTNHTTQKTSKTKKPKQNTHTAPNQPTNKTQTTKQNHHMPPTVIDFN